ncbi:MAG: NifU family protein [Actinobacteria bacterium]|nr:NifU family protein [Actinomycetota bacterium]
MSTILTIAPDALDMIVKLRDNEPGDDEFALSLAVTGVRGIQYSYELAFVPLADKGIDWILERHGDLAVILPEEDVPKLDGASLELTESGLAMNNPNVPTSPSIPGLKAELTGPLAEQVDQFLTEQINPAIAMHGGGAELVGVDGTTAYLRLYGGCQGCGMAQVTLRQGIERALLENIPELTAIVDVTDHASGENPYYHAHAH